MRRTRGRVVLVVPAFPKLSETFIVSKFVGLLDRGWDVHVVCGRGGGDWSAFEALRQRPDLRRRVHVARPTDSAITAAAHFPRAIATLALRQPAAAFRYAKSRSFRSLYLDESILSLRPDIVHFEFGTLALGRMDLKDSCAARIVVSFRGFDLNYVGLDKPGFYDEVWSCADAVHTLGSDLWKRALRRGCPRGMAHVLIPPAIDAEYFKRSVPRKERSGAIRILSVGRLTWKKGYEFALQAVRHLKDRGIAFRYTIIGNGEAMEALSFARFQLGLEDDVRFAGRMSPAGVRSVLQESDLLLHAAVSEGFCNAALEAQAMEVPVVAADADGLGENILHGETGFLVPRRNPAALAEKLERLAADPRLRAKMGAAGRRRVERQFRIEDQLDRFEAFYEAVNTGRALDRVPDAELAPLPVE